MANITLNYDGKTLEFPLTVGSEKEGGIDIAKLRSSSGLVTLDPGFLNTASTTSAITFLDGEKGILRYRGYPIEQLAEKSTFIEVAYLLLYGELPSASQLAAFQASIAAQSLVPEDLKHLYRAFPRHAHPMAMLGSAINALSAFNDDANDPNVPAEVELATHRILAQLPVLAAWGYKHSKNQPFVYPDASLGYTANFLKTLFGVPTEQYAVDDEIRGILDLLLILHADHEQNCSTSTVRIVGSSKANLFTSVNAGISALSGPRHGGANEACLNMLEDIQRQGGISKVGEFMEKVKDKNSGVKLMGFGHRVYKNYDPRAKLMQETCDEVLAELGLQNDPLFKLAKEVEKIALEDDYFVSRKLYPNVDFYSGIVQRAIGIPVHLFTGVFALARTVGWIAQLNEMISDPEYKIGRPRQLYTGSVRRDIQSGS